MHSNHHRHHNISMFPKIWDSALLARKNQRNCVLCIYIATSCFIHILQPSIPIHNQQSNFSNPMNLLFISSTQCKF